MSPFLVLNLLNACCSDCWMFFHWLPKSVTIFIKCLSLSHFTVLYFVLSRYFGVKAFLIKPTVCKMLRTCDWLAEDERNCKHNSKMLKFLFLQFVFALRNQALWNNLDLCLTDVQLWFLLNLTWIQSDWRRSCWRRKKKLSSLCRWNPCHIHCAMYPL